MYDDGLEFTRIPVNLANQTASADLAAAPTDDSVLVVKRLVIGQADNAHTAGMIWGLTDGAGTYYLGPFTLAFPNDHFAKDLSVKYPKNTKVTLTVSMTGTSPKYSAYAEIERRK